MKIKSKRILLTLMLVCMNVSMLTMGVDAAGSSKLKAPVVTLSNVASSGKIKVSWKKINKAVSYSVYRSTDGKKWSRILTTKNTSMTNTSAISGEKYYYKVRANASKSSNNSKYSKVKSRTCDLARPTITLSTVESSGKTKISWKKVEGATSYRVYNSRNKEDWKCISTTDKLSVVNTSATAGKKYYYKVRAICSNSSAYSAYSSIKYRTCKYPQGSTSDGDKDDVQTGNLSVYQKEVVDLAVDIAKNWKTEYVRSAKGEKVNGVYQFDCSGFATYVLNRVMEKSIPTYRLTSSLTKLIVLDEVYNGGYPGEFNAKNISRKNLQPGDVVFFSTYDTSKDHCGIYIGNNKFVHCSSSKDKVLISEITGYYDREYSMARRFIPSKITPANTVKVVKGGSFYARRETKNADLADKIGYLTDGSKVTVLYTGNSPASYNCAYVRTANGTKGFIYTHKIK